MRANVLTVMENGAPLLLPMDSEDGNCLHYTENGTLKGGYSVLSQVPCVPNTVLVWVEISETAFDFMIDTLDIEWWEVVNDPQEENQ